MLKAIDDPSFAVGTGRPGRDLVEGSGHADAEELRGATETMAQEKEFFLNGQYARIEKKLFYSLGDC
jgi:hypothetical protein